MSGDAAQIDLHGMDAASARHELDTFLHQSFMRGDEVVEIIHGRGEGLLMEAVRKSLSSHELVEDFRPGHETGQIGGVTYAVLAKKNA